MTKLRPSSLLPFAAAVLLACGDDDPEAPSTLKLRIAHLAPDAPAVDVCLAPSGSARFSGPVLEGAGGASGLAYGQATRYLDVAAGQWDVRVVAASAADCATPIVPDTTGVTLAAARAITVAATGLVAPGAGQPGFALVPLEDVTQVAPDRARVRFVHASPGTPAVDVGTGSGASFTPVFTAVTFPGIDADLPAGYFDTAPLTGVTLSARATGTTADALVVPGVTLPAGTVATVFAVGLLGGAPPLSVLVCADDLGATALLGACAIAP
jgi:hypothetical protein